MSWVQHIHFRVPIVVIQTTHTLCLMSHTLGMKYQGLKKNNNRLLRLQSNRCNYKRTSTAKPSQKNFSSRVIPAVAWFCLSGFVFSFHLVYHSTEHSHLFCLSKLSSMLIIFNSSPSVHLTLIPALLITSKCSATNLFMDDCQSLLTLNSSKMNFLSLVSNDN